MRTNITAETQPRVASLMQYRNLRDSTLSEARHIATRLAALADRHATAKPDDNQGQSLLLHAHGLATRIVSELERLRS